VLRDSPAEQSYGVHDCKWKIDAPAGQRVRVDITKLSFYSSGDHLRFGDGADASEKELADKQWYDESLADDQHLVTSSGSAMYVTFTTGSGTPLEQHTGLGFTLQYTAIVATPAPTPGWCSDEERSLSATPALQVLRDSPAEQSYGVHDCKWKIEAPAGQQVRVDITKLSFYDGGDHLRFFDGADASATELADKHWYDRSLADDQHMVTSSGSAMYVTFTTNSWTPLEQHTGLGFTLQYTTIVTTPAPTPKYCSGEELALSATREMQVFRDSPRDQAYGANHDCRWLINAPAGDAVVLEFSRMALSYGDKVLVYDGSSASATLLSTHQHSDKGEKPAVSTGRTMYVRFETDGANHDIGFTALFRTVPQLPTASPTTASRIP
jgi:hypothetical protein